MGAPEKLVDGRHGVQGEACLLQRRGVAGEGGRIAGDHHHASELGGRYVANLGRRARARGVEDDGVETGELARRQGGAGEVAALHADRLETLRHSGGALERVDRIGVAFDRVDGGVGGEPEGEGAKPGIEISDETGAADGFHDKAAERGLPIGGGLQKRAGRRGDLGRANAQDGLAGLVERRAVPREPRQVRLPRQLGEVRQRGGGKPGRAAAQLDVEAGVGQRGGHVEPARSGEQALGKGAQRGAGGFKRGRKHGALGEVEELIAGAARKAEKEAHGLGAHSMKGRAAASGAGGVKERADFGLETGACESLPDQAALPRAISLAAPMLERAAPADAEMAAGGRDPVAARLEQRDKLAAVAVKPRAHPLPRQCKRHKGRPFSHAIPARAHLENAQRAKLLAAFVLGLAHGASLARVPHSAAGLAAFMLGSGGGRHHRPQRTDLEGPMSGRILIALGAGLVALAAPAAAQAGDDYGYHAAGPYGGYDDPCRDVKKGRQASGAVLGALLGGLAGNGAAADNTKTEGAVLGAVLGAAIGSQIGRGSANCEGYVAAPYGGYGYQSAGFGEAGAPAPLPPGGPGDLFGGPGDGAPYPSGDSAGERCETVYAVTTLPDGTQIREPRQACREIYYGDWNLRR